jgi:hypothetical protein
MLVMGFLFIAADASVKAIQDSLSAAVRKVIPAVHPGHQAILATVVIVIAVIRIIGDTVTRA